MTDVLDGPVTVRAPATSANLGPGFDCLALCLDLADVVTAEVVSTGTEVTILGEGADDLPRDDAHLVMATIRGALDAWQIRQPGLRLTCRNAIPQGRGLGSSAAAIVAGLRIAEALSPGPPRSDVELLAVATAIEGHADNVAGCLFGGLVLTWTGDAGPSFVRLAVDDRVVPIVFCADRPMSTSVARGLLPSAVPHAVAAANSARVGLLVAGLSARPDLLLAATHDELHQEARRSAYPDTMRLVDDLREQGIPAVVSGAGPSVLALCSRETSDVAAAAAPPGWRVLTVSVDNFGARTVAI